MPIAVCDDSGWEVLAIAVGAATGDLPGVWRLRIMDNLKRRPARN
jgi:hypothetical protein